MDLIKINEVSRLKKWAETNRDMMGLKEQEDNICDSYWILREREDTYIMEYDFRTIPEFKSICKSVGNKIYDDEIMKIISVSAFKCSPQFEKEEEQTAESGQSLGRMPEYIYMF